MISTWHLLWIVPMFMFFWAIVHVGNCDPPKQENHN